MRPGEPLLGRAGCFCSCGLESRRLQLRAWSAQVLVRLMPGELVLAGAAWRAGACSCGLESLEVLAVAASWVLNVLLLNGALYQFLGVFVILSIVMRAPVAEMLLLDGAVYQFLVVPAILPIILPALVAETLLGIGS